METVAAIVAVMVAAAVVLGLCLLFGGDSISCPECDGGKRRPPGPCPTCGHQTTIKRGSQPAPRGAQSSGSRNARVSTHVPRIEGSRGKR